MIYNLRRQKEDERDLLYADKMMQVEKLPSNVDIRHECPAVFDQGQLGSCSANAGCANIVMLLKAPVILSRLYMYYKERELEDNVYEDSGAQMRDICKVAVKGVCEDKYMPYVIKDFAKEPSAEAVAHATFKVGSYHKVRNLQEIKHVLAVDSNPVLMGMEVYSSFESDAVKANGIVPMPTPADEKLGGHAVLIVGYDDKKKCLIVRNSWGENWGDKGYFYLPYQFIINGFAFDFWELEL